MPQSHKQTSAETAIHPHVDPSSAEDLLGAVGLGQRIRRLRLKRSMGLVELGKLTGLSASFLSQLETGRVIPTLRNLARLAIVFEKDLSYFFHSGEEGVFRVQRARDRVRLKMGAPDIDYIAESFGILIPEGGVRPCMAEFLPGDSHVFSPDTYSGVEMIYVTQGSLELHRSGERYTLNEQDLVYIGGDTHRLYKSANDRPAKAIIISFDGEHKTALKTKRQAA